MTDRELPPLPEKSYLGPPFGYDEDDMRAYAEAAIKQEREACFRACLDLKGPDLDHAPDEYHRFAITVIAFAAAIRARSPSTPVQEKP